MKRRNFLIFGSAFGLLAYFGAKKDSARKDKDNVRKDNDFKTVFASVESTIAQVQAHMFPPNSNLPSASAMNATFFLSEAISHQCFDRDTRAFILEGAQELQTRIDGDFTALTFEQKEQALRAYEETGYGSSWLSQIMRLTMEAIFSDPIYGGNTDELGWKTLQSYGGFPRPTQKYIGVDHV
jgi:hypothetical protein